MTIRADDGLRDSREGDDGDSRTFCEIAEVPSEGVTIVNFVRRAITPYVLSFRKSRSLVSFMRATRERRPRPRAVDSDADADADVDADAGAAREATSARHVRFLVLCTRSIGAAGVRLTAPLSRPAAAIPLARTSPPPSNRRRSRLRGN